MVSNFSIGPMISIKLTFKKSQRVPTLEPESHAYNNITLHEFGHSGIPFLDVDVNNSI